MARITTYDDLTAWIDSQTKEISRCKYGRNRKSILQGIEEQNKKSREIAELDGKLSQILNKTYDNEKKKRLVASYDALKAVVEKKLHCLETMLQVASLEENCSRVSRDFDLRSVNLVKEEKIRMEESHGKSVSSSESISSVSSIGKSNSGFVATSAQDCINGLRNNWDWVSRLVKCIDIHLKNGSDYHQFYHEVEESEPWMLEDFKRFSKALDSQTTKNEKDNARQLETDIDSINIALRQWEAKTNRLLNMASTLVPVPLRTDGIKEPTPVTSLCDYETADISFCNGEDLLLIDNSNPDLWRVRNGKNEEAEVPPVIILIPGPCKEAMDTASKLQMQLLTAWTNALKRIGVRLLCYMLTVFKPEYNMREITALASMEEIDKAHLLKLLTHIEGSLKKYWGDHEGFVSLQERLLALRVTLEEIGSDEQKDAELYKNLIVEIAALGQIMNIYQDMFKDWEKFKVAMETSRAPELMLIVDKWEQLQFVSREYFAKYWKMNLPLNETEKAMMRTRNFTLDGVHCEDTIGLLSPRLDSSSTTLSVDTTPAVQRSVVRKLDLEEHTTYNDDVFNEEKTSSTMTSSVETRNWESVDGRRNGKGYDEMRADVTVQRIMGKEGGGEGGGRGGAKENEWQEGGFNELKTNTLTVTLPTTRILGREEGEGGGGRGGAKDNEWQEGGFNELKTNTTTMRILGREEGEGGGRGGAKDNEWQEGGFNESRTKTTTTVILGNNGHQEKDKGLSESGFDESRTLTTTTLKYGTQRQRNGNLEELEKLEDSFDESRMRTIITDSVRYGKAVADDGGSSGSGGSRESPARFIRKMHSSQTSVSEVKEGKFEELEDIDFSLHNRLSSSEYEGARFGIASETKTAETEQLSSAEMEEKKTFHIKSVVNPNDQTEISLQQAILLGVIRPTEGVYVNSVSGNSLPIATAMADQLIKVMFSTTKRTPEKFSSIGIITVKTIRKLARPCTIVTVKDTLTNEVLTPDEAHRRGILDDQQVFYKDRTTGKMSMIAEAVEKNFMTVEFSGEQPEPEVISKTYAVRAVVDRRMKKTVTFHEAVRRGIIDRESGAFRDTMTNEKMYVGDAIMRGFLKARHIEDAHGLNIDPENKMVIDKTQKIRERLLKPLKVISAFKLAAKEGAAKK